MAGPFYHCFNREASLFAHFKHQEQTMLDQGKPGGGMEISSLLFFPGMGCMIGGKNGNPAIRNRLANRIAVACFFNRRVALDQGA